MSAWSGATGVTYAAFAAAANGVVELVRTIDGEWDRPGLGAWDLRALVGHTSRSLVTVASYLDQPAVTEDIDSAAAYVALSNTMVGADAEAVAERGRQAGRDLGPDPAATVAERAATALAKVGAADPETLLTTIGGGMRLRSYLPTRTFELVVHGYDIADATGIDVDFGDVALGAAVALAAEVAVRLDHGTDLLRALTGRGEWPAGFVVVR